MRHGLFVVSPTVLRLVKLGDSEMVAVSFMMQIAQVYLTNAS
jgi:hypothetical protein